MTQTATLRNESEQKGIVVWDQQGLVVVWSDQHRSRFSWEALRHICLCTECQEQQRTEQKTIPPHVV